LQQYPALFPASALVQIAHEHVELRCQRLEPFLGMRHGAVNIHAFQRTGYQAFQVIQVRQLIYTIRVTRGRTLLTASAERGIGKDRWQGLCLALNPTMNGWHESGQAPQ